MSSPLSPKPGVLTPASVRYQDYISSQRHGDGRGHPASLSGGDAPALQHFHHPEMLSNQISTWLKGSFTAERIHFDGSVFAGSRPAFVWSKCLSSYWIFTRWHTIRVMTGPRTSPMPAESHEERPSCPSTLQNLLSNDFRVCGQTLSYLPLLQYQSCGRLHRRPHPYPL
ncbi:hypothetical protein DFH94DRAFT_124076 [Russula ochroleuca]|jgi:hypothetical protein|uniref:Uncharacterized protein n=1 Tax=Russula ochroleuca TaxID=152965 RepID=A0A9P5K0B7_9AGAM|nr:hypothetical protein DFH94DRAFT_124076 [Russula ochroleuca]